MPFTDAGSGLSGVLRIDAQDHMARPYATIYSVANPLPECQRFVDGEVGADLVVNGYTSQSAGTWVYSDGVGAVPQWVTGY